VQPGSSVRPSVRPIHLSDLAQWKLSEPGQLMDSPGAKRLPPFPVKDDHRNGQRLSLKHLTIRAGSKR
jgi:hypothetical protein